MQNVSQEWKDNHKELLVSESEIELKMRVTDPDAYEDASAEDNGATYFSQTDDVVSGMEYEMTPTATFEQNLWVLDGKCKVLDNNNYGTNRYLGNIICKADKTFTTNPVINISFSRVHSNLIQGITIVWSTLWNEYAEEFIITAYNGDTIVNTQTFTDNTDVKFIAYMDLSEYDSITIEVVKWSLAYRRARIEEIVIGIDKTFTKSDIFSYSHLQTVSPLSTELPKTEISFAIDNVDSKYNPHNPHGLSKYLIERQEIKVRYGYKINGKTEWIDGGRTYLSDWDAPQDGMTASFVTSDLLEFMRKTYYGGMYYPNGISLYDLAILVLTDANLPKLADGSVRWKIDDSLKEVFTTAPLPIDTHANCLQLIANAGECVMYQDRQGFLTISKLNITDSDYSINYFNSYSKSNITLSKPIKDVSVSFYQFSIAKEETELYNGVVDIRGTKELIITYSESAVEPVATVSGGTLNNAIYYTNACILTITADSDVTINITGKSLLSNSTEILIYNNDSGETITVANSLITSLTRATIIGEWIRDYYSKRMTLSSSWRADPRLDALDIVTNGNEYNTSRVLMTEVKYDYNGAFKGSGEGKVI